MKRIAIIACDNGLGHVRRCYIIGLVLANRGDLVDLYAPKQSFEKFKSLFDAHLFLKNVDFSTGTSSVGLLQSDPFSLNWYRRLPDMSIYDVVVSDNLPEILYVRPDAILSGHFFWHEDLETISKGYQQACQTLIELHNPIVIATELFASEKIRACKKFIPVGLYIYGNQDADALKGDALLITGGATTSLRVEMQRLVQFFVLNGPGMFKTVYVDSALIVQSCEVKDTRVLPEWLELAAYDVAMYKRVSVAICRSGVGTITDLLQYGGKAYCVYESGNKEMVANARRLEERGLGVSIGDPRSIEQLGLTLGKYDAAERASFARSINSLHFDGASKAAMIILGDFVG